MISPWMGDHHRLQNWWQRSDSDVWLPASWRAWISAYAQGLRTGLSWTMVLCQRRWRVWSGEEVPGSPRKPMVSFGTKLPWEGGSVADSIWGTMRNLYCLLVISYGRVSLMIMHVKAKQAWSPVESVAATCYSLYMNIYFHNYKYVNITLFQFVTGWLHSA